MLLQEFIDRTGFYPTYDEYRAIEQLYNEYPQEKDKDDFCKDFKRHPSMLTKARELACASFAAEREAINKEKGELVDKLRDAQMWRDYDCKEAERKYEALRKEFDEYKQTTVEFTAIKQQTIEDKQAYICQLEAEVADLQQKLEAFKTVVSVSSKW